MTRVVLADVSQENNALNALTLSLQCIRSVFSLPVNV